MILPQISIRDWMAVGAVIECPVWYTVAAIGLISCLCYGESLHAEPIKLDPSWCAEYSRDAYKAAVARAAGRSKEEAVAMFQKEQGSYPTNMWAHVLTLIDNAYASNLLPGDFKQGIYKDCLDNDGWIERDT